MDRSTYGSPFGNESGWFTESSTKTPKFYQLRKLEKRLPVNYYKWTRIDCKHPLVQTYNGLRNENHARGFYSMNECINTGYLSTVAGGLSMKVQKQSDAVSLVSNRLLSKVRNRPVDLGVALGEYRQTAAFVSSVMVKIVKSGRQLKKGNISKALQIITGRKNASWRDIPNVASDMWLAYSYALRPLLMDVYGSVKALADSKRPYVVVEKVRTGMVFPVKGSLTAPGKYTSTVDASMRVSGEIWFSVSNPLTRSLDMLGLLNPMSVAWELVTLSFVVDWFLPIGKYLSEIVPPQGVDFVDGWVSVKTNGGVSHRTDINSDTGWHTSLTSKEVCKERIKLTSFPRYNVVVPDVSLSKEKIASGLALLWANFGSKRGLSGLRV